MTLKAARRVGLPALAVAVAEATRETTVASGATLEATALLATGRDVAAGSTYGTLTEPVPRRLAAAS